MGNLAANGAAAVTPAELDFAVTMAGSVVFVLLGLLFLWIATSFEAFDRYGREALRVAAAFVFMFALTRTANAMDWLHVSDARAINTIWGGILAAVIVQIILTRQVRQGMAKQANRERTVHFRL